MKVKALVAGGTESVSHRHISFLAFDAQQFGLTRENAEIVFKKNSSRHQFSLRAKFIGIGASCAYPDSAWTMTENEIFDDAIHGNVYTCGAAKHLLAKGIRRIAKWLAENFDALKDRRKFPHA